MDDSRVEAQLFKALMHPARLRILDVLQNGEACVCHLEAVLGLRQAYISQQLMVLREAGLVRVRRQGVNIYYDVADPRLFAVLAIARQITGTDRRQRQAASPKPCPCPKCAPVPASAVLAAPAR